MGHGIAQVCAQNGFMVRLYDIKEEFIIRGKTNIVKTLEKGIVRGKVTEQEKNTVFKQSGLYNKFRGSLQRQSFDN